MHGNVVASVEARSSDRTKRVAVIWNGTCGSLIVECLGSLILYIDVSKVEASKKVDHMLWNNLAQRPVSCRVSA